MFLKSLVRAWAKAGFILLYFAILCCFVGLFIDHSEAFHVNCVLIMYAGFFMAMPELLRGFKPFKH